MNTRPESALEHADKMRQRADTVARAHRQYLNLELLLLSRAEDDHLYRYYPFGDEPVTEIWTTTQPVDANSLVLARIDGRVRVLAVDNSHGINVVNVLKLSARLNGNEPGIVDVEKESPMCFRALVAYVDSLGER